MGGFDGTVRVAYWFGGCLRSLGWYLHDHRLAFTSCALLLLLPSLFFSPCQPSALYVMDSILRQAIKGRTSSSHAHALPYIARFQVGGCRFC